MNKSLLIIGCMLFAASALAKSPDASNLNEIESITEEAPVDLDFDTAEYLPEGFDPYRAPEQLDAINFIDEENIDLGFDTSKYLPKDFDAYAGSN